MPTEASQTSQPSQPITASKGDSSSESEADVNERPPTPPIPTDGVDGDTEGSEDEENDERKCPTFILGFFLFKLTRSPQVEIDELSPGEEDRLALKVLQDAHHPIDSNHPVNNNIESAHGPGEDEGATAIVLDRTGRVSRRVRDLQFLQLF